MEQQDAHCQGPATPSAFAFVFAASKRDAMLLHLPYSIVVTTPDVRCRERERDTVLFWEMPKKTPTRTRFWCGRAFSVHTTHLLLKQIPMHLLCQLTCADGTNQTDLTSPFPNTVNRFLNHFGFWTCSMAWLPSLHNGDTYFPWVKEMWAEIFELHVAEH